MITAVKVGQMFFSLVCQTLIFLWMHRNAKRIRAEFMAFKYLTLKIEIPRLKFVVIINCNVYKKLYKSCSNSVGPLFDVKNSTKVKKK